MQKASLIVLFALIALPAAADEGMWPYNMANKDEVQRKYGFTMTDSWLDNAMKASVRFNNGGSGSFVSRGGLVMTNHHVGADCIQKLSTGEGAVDVMKEGFYAADRAAEKRCPDLELNQLGAIEDVTARVEAAAASGDDAAKNTARKAEMAKIEKECTDALSADAKWNNGKDVTPRCDVVTLYGGGAYHLYKYKKFTDIRLVFAPEFGAAFFGGDPDNFTFPRYCLDSAFFRVYSNDKPVVTANYFPFSKDGAQDGELVFVSGNPGSTGRYSTVADLQFLRDTVYPWVLQKLADERTVLRTYMDKGDAEYKVARDDFFGIENSIKALTGYLSGLKDPAIMKIATDREALLRQKVAASKEAKRIGPAWPRLAKAYKSYAGYYREYAVTERFFSPSSGALASKARHLLRLGDELAKPSEKRLREYRDSNLKSLELALFSTAPMDKGLEIRKIAFGLDNMKAVLGSNNELVVKALQGKTSMARATELVNGTRVFDVAFRKELRAGGKAAVKKAHDPLIEFIRGYDKVARFIRQRYENEVQAVERSNKGLITEAYNIAFGQSIYPDATFTLRINQGVVRGVPSQKTPWATRLGGLYVKSKRAGNKEPYQLSPRWLEAKSRVDFTVPVNFISTNDIIGGNSGSPVFNKKAEIVGLIFDGNMAQLPNRFVYTDKEARSVSVHSRFITYALRNIYGATALVEELAGK